MTAPRRAPLALMACALMLIGASFLPRKPLLIWNFTASAPIGLYRVLDRPWTRGDWVAARVPRTLAATLDHAGALAPGRLLIKRVAAAQGDLVCREGGVILINNRIAARARASGYTGAPLPVWAGCRRLSINEVLLLGPADGSFDGRYFGVTASADIVAPIVFVPCVRPMHSSHSGRSGAQPPTFERVGKRTERFSLTLRSAARPEKNYPRSDVAREQ